MKRFITKKEIIDLIRMYSFYFRINPKNLTQKEASEVLDRFINCYENNFTLPYAKTPNGYVDNMIETYMAERGY